MNRSVIPWLLHVIGLVQGLGTVVLPGDVYIEFIGAIYFTPARPDQNPTCSDIEVQTVQNIQAIKWTLEQVNKDPINYNTGAKVGLRVSQTCNKDGEDKTLALKLAAELQNSDRTDIIGVIGSDYSSESEAISRLLSSLPAQYRLLQFGFSSTSVSLSNRDIYSNFFRTIPSDNIQVEAMHKFTERLNWTYMAIIHDNDPYGAGGVNGLLAEMKNWDICFPVIIAVEHLSYNETTLEQDIENKIIGADIPISGIVVFGSSRLAELTLSVTENIIKRNASVVRPVFLFSEAGGYIEGHKTNISRGAFVLSPPRMIIKSFQDEWHKIFVNQTKLAIEVQNNNWLRNTVETKFNCSIANQTCKSINSSAVDAVMPASVYNQHAVLAALVMVKLAKIISQNKCSNGNCSSFYDTNKTPRDEFIRNMHGLRVNPDRDFGNFRLPEFQDPDLILDFIAMSPEVKIPDEFPLYEVYNHQICNSQTGANCLKKAAKYTGSKSLEVLTASIKDYDKNGNEMSWPNIRKPQCPDGFICPVCLELHDDESVLFIPGDVYIVGIAPVHNKGDSPLKCGTIKRNGVDIVEVIRFAVDESKTKLSAKIGVIIIDSCNDPQIIQEKILTLNRLGVYVDGQYIFVKDKIIGYIGGWSSDVSKSVAEITSRLKYPQISYASTAAVLSDRSKYPYFLRVPSSDRKQAQSILEIVRYFGATAIQIVYSDTAYGIGGRDLLLELASSPSSASQICIVQTISVATSSDNSEVLSKMRAYPSVKVVVMFISSFELEYLVDTLNTIERNEFLFISSEEWGTRLDVTPYTNLVGSITLTSQLPINAIFDKRMKSLSPSRSDPSPWTRPYLEKLYNCYYEWNYNKSSNHPCSGSESLDSIDFRIEAWAPFAERAVYTLLEAARLTLIAKCNGYTNSLCPRFRNETYDFLEAVRNVQVQVNGFYTRVYDHYGDGLAGYKIYQVALSRNGAYYKNIEQSGPGPFSLDTSITVNSTCNSKISKCLECFPIPIKPTTPSKDDSFPGGAIAAIVILVIVCCILAGVLLFMCNRHGCCFRIENGRPKFTDSYLTPVYMRERTENGVGGTEYRPELPKRDTNYVKIPESSVSYNRSQTSNDSKTSNISQTSSFSRLPVSDGSVSTSASGGIMGRSDIIMTGSQPAAMSGMENLAYGKEEEVERPSGVPIRRSDSQQPSSGFGTMSLENSISESDKGPEPHAFQKTKLAPAIPSAVVYQADGSYITARGDSVPASDRGTSNGSVVSSGSGGSLPQKHSDQSLGYLHTVHTLDDK